MPWKLFGPYPTLSSSDLASTSIFLLTVLKPTLLFLFTLLHWVAQANFTLNSILQLMKVTEMAVNVSFSFIPNVFKYHVSRTDGKISVRIKIEITLSFGLHHRPYQLVMLVTVGLLLKLKTSSAGLVGCWNFYFVTQPGLLTVNDLNYTVNSSGWATEETFQQSTRPTENYKVLTKGLQELT